MHHAAKAKQQINLNRLIQSLLELGEGKYVAFL
jgi:hypothetical protein